jgi:hypothetical protein
MHAEIGDFVTDGFQNAVESGGSYLTLWIDQSDYIFQFIITDNGKGMDSMTLHTALDPFVTDRVKHPTRKVGLGLPFLVQALEACNGTFDITSEPRKGTKLTASFPLDHVDAPPVGDIPMTLVQCMGFQGTFECLVTRRLLTQAKSFRYEFLRTELLDAVGGLEAPGAFQLMKEFIQSQEE